MHLIIFEDPTPVRATPSNSGTIIYTAMSGEHFSSSGNSGWISVTKPGVSGYIYYNAANHILVEDDIFELILTDANLYLRGTEDFLFLDGRVEQEGVYKLGADYEIGDIVSVMLNPGNQIQNSRIVELSYLFHGDTSSVVPVFEKFKERND